MQIERLGKKIRIRNIRYKEKILYNNKGDFIVFSEVKISIKKNKKDISEKMVK